jgi:hypothetical protein
VHLQRLIAHQAGIISRGQAIDAGLTPDAVDRRLRLRRWLPVHPGIYLTDGRRREDSEVRARAAVLWAGPGAVLSGPAAAWWHGMVGAAPETITLTAARPPRPRPGVGVRIHRLGSDDLDELRGLPVTAAALTVLDTAVELGAAGAAFLDRALRRGPGFPAVHAAHLRNRHAPGAASATRVLLAAADRSAAVAEATLVRLLRDSGVSGWRRGFRVAGRRASVAFPVARVAVEATGWAWRWSDPAGPAAQAGWRLTYVSWADLTERPQQVLSEIEAVLAQGSRPT